MNMIRCLIVDDEPIGREILENFVKKINFLEVVAVCEDPFEALEIMENDTVDLLLSDIQMPEINGLEFVRSLPSQPVIIFVTAHDNYAVNSFELGVTDYLLKPVSFQRFLKAINKARVQIENRRNLAATSSELDRDYFFVRSNNKLTKILYSEVEYIESIGDYIKVFTTGQPVLSYNTLKSIESKLPSDQFIRIHNSYIISLNAVKAVDGNTVELLNGVSLPIAKGRKEDLFAALHINDS